MVVGTGDDIDSKDRFNVVNTDSKAQSHHFERYRTGMAVSPVKVIFLTALLTITHVKYNKLNSQKEMNKVIRSKGQVRTGREDPCEAPPMMIQIIIKTRTNNERTLKKLGMAGAGSYN